MIDAAKIKEYTVRVCSYPEPWRTAGLVTIANLNYYLSHLTASNKIILDDFYEYMDYLEKSSIQNGWRPPEREG